jgi:hypothetical protein
VDSSVSEGNSASVFKVDMSKTKIQLVFTSIYAGLPGRWPPNHMKRWNSEGGRCSTRCGETLWRPRILSRLYLSLEQIVFSYNREVPAIRSPKSEPTGDQSRRSLNCYCQLLRLWASCIWLLAMSCAFRNLSPSSARSAFFLDTLLTSALDGDELLPSRSNCL